VDKVRKMEAKGNPLLKNTRFIFLKNRNNLTDKQMKILEDLSLAKLNLKTVRALQIRENFQSIYNAGSKDEFIILLRKWYFWATHSRLQPMIKAAKTIKNHWAGVIKWIESMLSNAILEGLNSVIQAVKARARGFRTFRNFRIIACLVTGKLDFNLVNSYYVKS
jgi:transposase